MTDKQLNELLLKYHTALKVAQQILNNPDPDLKSLKEIIKQALL